MVINLAIALAAGSRSLLPLSFQAYIDDFILELLAGKALRQPMEGVMTIAFHVGVPVLFAFGLRRARRLPDGDDA
ncbi:MAG: hypothetical protein H0X17_00040 [Deltaproteobacteria bacterium]|nr:hypothetical protein [Deltaproteobacteria bacterium]